MDARHKNVVPAMPRTCNWLFEHDDFIAWTDKDQRVAHRGFLWIKGKPGSGKSTIMKEAMRWVKRRRSQHVISFFFNARGSHELEKSTLGLYRSLVYQLLQVNLSRSSEIREFFAVHFRSKHRNGTTEAWSVDELQDFIVQVAKDYAEQSLNIFIDALDECHEKEIRDMVSFLEDLASHATSSGMDLKICLSSRHYPHISIRHGLPLIVEQQAGHQGDLITYIHGKLIPADTPEMNQLRHDLCEKAAGIFLWVVLVIPILNETYDHGGTPMDMKQQLRTIPGELEGLFTNIINRYVSKKAEFSVLTRWVLYSLRPFNPTELHLAIRYFSNDATMYSASEEAPEADALMRYILNASRGLAEVTKANPPVVQFIHETVRDFFLRHDTFAELKLSGPMNGVGQIHDEMKLCCLQYLNSIQYLNSTWMISPSWSPSEDQPTCRVIDQLHHQQRELSERRFPFLHYATSGVFHHAALAQENGISQRDFLSGLCDCDQLVSMQGSHASKLHLRRWKEFYNLFERHKIRRYTPGSTLLYILSEQGLTPLVACVNPSPRSVNEPAGRYGSAFQAACASGHVALVSHFLAIGADVNARGALHNHAFLAAIYNKHHLVADLLLQQGLSVPQTLLTRCFHAMIAARSNVRCLQAVLRAGADVSARDSSGMMPLMRAIVLGRKEIVQCLIGAAVNVEDDNGEDLVGYCISHRKFDIANMLVDAGAPCDITQAVKIGNTHFIERLLRAKVEPTDEPRDPLYFAVERGNIRMVEHLLAKFRYHSKDKRAIFARALCISFIKGDTKMFQVLLEHGATMTDSRWWPKTILIGPQADKDTNVMRTCLAWL